MLLLHAVEQPMVESCSVLVLELIVAQEVSSHRNAIHEFSGRAFAYFGSTLAMFNFIAFLDVSLLWLVLGRVTAGEVEIAATEPTSDRQSP